MVYHVTHLIMHWNIDKMHNWTKDFHNSLESYYSSQKFDDQKEHEMSIGII